MSDHRLSGDHDLAKPHLKGGAPWQMDVKARSEAEAFPADVRKEGDGVREIWSVFHDGVLSHFWLFLPRGPVDGRLSAAQKP